MAKKEIIIEFIGFIKERKLWWIIPIVIILLTLGIILVATQGSVIAPLIYTFF